MFAKVYLSGVVKNMVVRESKETILTVVSTKTVEDLKGPVTQTIETFVVLREGYEKYSGKVEKGDYVNVGGYMLSELADGVGKGGPLFNKQTGLPYFAVRCFALNNVGVLATQYNNDEFNVIMVGYVGRDPEMRYTPKGTAVTSFSLATSYRHAGSDGQKVSDTTWWSITAWSRDAENINEYVSKGMLLLVEGAIMFDPETHGPRTWQDKNSGEIRSRFEVQVRIYTMLKSSGDGSNTVHDRGSIPLDDEQPEEAKSQTKKEEKNDNEEYSDIPF